MARISGMILGLGLLVIFSSLVSPASAWDDDDDDGYKRRRRSAHPIHRQPVVIPPRSVERHFHGGEDYFVPSYPRDQYPRPPLGDPLRHRGPFVPAPLPPSAFEEGHDSPHGPMPLPSVGVPVHHRPGQFVDAAVPLYPGVRVKDQDEAPRHGVHRILAVKSPDPFRFPGCVYVQVCVPPDPCRKVEVSNGGADIKLEYGDHEIEVSSRRGVVTVEYDD